MSVYLLRTVCLTNNGLSWLRPRLKWRFTICWPNIPENLPTICCTTVAPGGKTVVLDMLRVVTTYSQHSDCDLLRLLCRLPTSSLIDCNIRSSHLRRSCLDNLNVGWPLVAPLTGINIASSVCPGWPGWDKSKPKNDAVGAKTKKSLNQKFFN